MSYIHLILILVLLIAFYFFKGVIPKIIFIVRWYFISKDQFSNKDEEVLKKGFLPYSKLTTAEQDLLKKKILYFLKYKKFCPLQGVQITREMQLLISACACFLVLNIPGEIFPGLYNIYISMSSFVEKENILDLETMEPKFSPRLGESWQGGPVVLSWSTVEQDFMNWYDGHNVVLHEFAHQLDGLDGGMDGTPPLKSRGSLNKWAFFMENDFKELRNKVAHHQKSDIGSYGATNAAEFFAVTVEEFYEKPHAFKKNHPEIFDLYLEYFKFDPTRLS